MNRILIAALVACAAAGCASMGMGNKLTALANLEPTTGNSARGTVTFTQDGDEVRVRANVSGLKPGAEHGFHVHEKGDCSSGDGMSAGGHFNPSGKPHGNPRVPDHHTGDMPMLVADASGDASLSMELGAMTVG